MIQIGKHKQYKITYVNMEFRAKKKGVREVLKAESERELRKLIDSTLDQLAIEQSEKRAQKELEEKHKNLTKARYEVDTKNFYDVIAGAYNLCSEAKIKFSNNKVTITTMDPANVALFHTGCEYEGPKATTEIMMNLNYLKDILKKTYKALNIHEINIQFKPGAEEDNIIMVLEGKGHKITVTGHKPVEKEVKVPELNHLATYKVSKTEFNNCIKAAKAIGSTLKFSSKNNKLNLSCKDEDKNNDYNTENIGKPQGKPIDCQSKYSIEYLENALLGKEPLLTGQEITIQTSQDYPLTITDEYGDYLILAPRVENS